MRFSPEMLAGLLILVAVSNVRSISADDFRMQTEVYQGRQKVAQTLTLFLGDIVYDFVQDDDQKSVQTTIFDWPRKRIIILDVERQLKTELTTVQLMEVLDYLTQRVYKPGDDDFEVEVDAAKKKMRLRGKKLIYEANGVAPEQAIAASQYQKFADWYARLNATRAGNPPPFARIRLNALMAAKGFIPAQITRSVQGSRKQVRSTHSTLWRLSKTDRDRIKKAGDQMATFQVVTPEEFWKSEQLAGGKE